MASDPLSQLLQSAGVGTAIFSHLDLHSLCQCAVVSKAWHTMTRDVCLYQGVWVSSEARTWCEPCCLRHMCTLQHCWKGTHSRIVAHICLCWCSAPH